MIPELDADLNHELPNEWTVVERPLLQQLVAMGWTYLQGDLDYPQKTFRDRFRDVLLRDKLRAAIRRINADEKVDAGFWKPIEAGINQLLRCSNMREDVELEEGIEQRRDTGYIAGECG